ncbi:MAG: hypothetical protein IKZ86_00795 [Spirochaetaceae bacterium]|nr:hypothetical protein [Spirochaetaceae bacterium]
MATSSIFANVHITTPEGAERFVKALELSEKDPPIPEPKIPCEYITDHEEIMRRLRRKFGENKE